MIDTRFVFDLHRRSRSSPDRPLTPAVNDVNLLVLFICYHAVSFTSHDDAPPARPSLHLFYETTLSHSQIQGFAAQRERSFSSWTFPGLPIHGTTIPYQNARMRTWGRSSERSRARAPLARHIAARSLARCSRSPPRTSRLSSPSRPRRRRPKPRRTSRDKDAIVDLSARYARRYDRECVNVRDR